MPSTICERLGRRFDVNATAITAEWAAAVRDRLGLEPSPFIEPANPWVVRGLAAHLLGADEGAAGTWRLADHARRIGETAEARGVIPEQILDGYTILNEILWRQARAELAGFEGVDAVAGVIPCIRRLYDAMQLLVRATTGAYFRRYQERIRKDAERLQSFNHMVSHELKGPLGAIQGAATLLAEESIVVDPGKRRRYIEIVLRNTTRMAELITDLLALTVAERVAGVSVTEPVSLVEVAESVRDRVADEAAERGVALELALPPARLAVDRRALELVLVNLVRNGVRYSDPAKRDRRVRLMARRRAEENAWVVAVEDNGVGIPEEVGARVFERFVRVRPEVPGTGLGLSIVKEVVERWGGRVWFESREGEGSTFYFTAPAPV